MGGLVNGQGGDNLARRNLGQPSGLLGFATAEHQGGCGRQGRRDQRRSGQGPARLFQHQTKAAIAKIGSAMGFGNDHACPAHLGHVGPGGGIKAGRALGIAQLAQGRDGGFFLGPVACRVPQHHLFFVQDSHWGFSLIFLLKGFGIGCPGKGRL